MQFLKKDSIDPNLYMRVYEAGYDLQQHTSFVDRLRAVGSMVPFGRMLRYWPVLGALIFGTVAGIELASFHRSAPGLQARSTVGASPVSPASKRGSTSYASQSIDRTAATLTPPLRAAPPVPKAIPASLSVLLSPSTQSRVTGPVRTRGAVEKAPEVEQRSRNIDLSALVPIVAKLKASASTAGSKVPPPPSPANLSAVPQVPNWTPLPQITAAPPAPPKTVTPQQPAVIPAHLHVSDPQPLRKVMPGKVNAGVMLYQDLDVQIKVTVGTDGRVTAARAVPTAEKVNQSLTGAALIAAQQWLFQPATLRGQAIPSDYLIVFRFHARQ